MRGGSRQGAGRKPGVPNKMTAELKEMILGALEEAGGQDYLKKQAEQNPGAFMTLIGKLVPTTLSGDPDRPLIPESILVKLVQP